MRLIVVKIGIALGKRRKAKGKCFLHRNKTGDWVMRTTIGTKSYDGRREGVLTASRCVTLLQVSAAVTVGINS